MTLKIKSKGSEVFPMENLQTETPIKLSTATKLYEPVRGSGSSSRYFVIGICQVADYAQGLKLAARVKGTTMSIRVEGEALQEPAMRSLLKSVGFSNVNENYGSFHVETKTETLQAKTVGATLLSLSVNGWLTPLPDVALIAQKGA